MIFCVEDDMSIRELVSYTLETTGLQTQGFEDGASMLETLQTMRPDLILLDVMLPGEDGISILNKLKSEPESKHIPVIMVTAKGSEYDKVVGLDSGADDYVTKPFGMMELVSRVKAVLRRSHQGNIEEMEEVLTAGEITLDIKKHEVCVGSRKVPLTLKEFGLLERLMKNRNVVLTRNQLLTEIWGYDFGGETRTVDVHVRTLRQKLGVEADIIETVRGVGYRISA
ncbi:MAG: response regulator transcription factor [Hespellia sp.]|nr:response regulator transcription factor [Hespellia sp.]